MSQQLTIIAKYTDWQWIAQCEHGILHLTWNRITMRLHPVECTRLAIFLEAWSPDDTDGIAFLRDESFRLMQSPCGRVQFWLYDTGLQLMVPDMLVLRKLVQYAASYVNSIKPDPVFPRSVARLTDWCELQTPFDEACSRN